MSSSAIISEALALATTRPIVSDGAVRLPLDRVADECRALDSGVPGKVLVLPHAGTTQAREPLAHPGGMTTAGDAR
jgi:hypothetical protein